VPWRAAVFLRSFSLGTLRNFLDYLNSITTYKNIKREKKKLCENGNQRNERANGPGENPGGPWRKSSQHLSQRQETDVRY
jgi:hypothetical protein